MIPWTWKNKIKKTFHWLTKINHLIILGLICLVAVISGTIGFHKGKNVGYSKVNERVIEQSKIDDEYYAKQKQEAKARRKKEKKGTFYNDPGNFHPSVVIDKKSLEKRTRRTYPYYSVQTLTIGKKNAKFYRLQTNKHFTAMRLIPIKSYDKENDQTFFTGINESSKNIDYKQADYANDDYYATTSAEYKEAMNANNSGDISLDQIANSHCPIPAFTNQKLNNRAVTYLPKDKLTEQDLKPFNIIKPNWYADFRFIRNFWLNNCSDYNNGNVHEIIEYNKHQYFRTAIDGLYLKDTDLSEINGKPVVVARDGYGNNSVGAINNTDLKVMRNKKTNNISKMNTIYFAGFKYHGKFDSYFSALAVNNKLFKNTIGGMYRNKITKKVTILSLDTNVNFLEKQLPNDYKSYIYSSMLINRITENNMQAVRIPTGQIISIKALPLKMAQFDQCDDLSLTKIDESPANASLAENEHNAKTNQQIFDDGGDDC